MISDIRAKHGKDSANLSGCGKFTLAEDLSDISDITSIDLSGIRSLEGECCRGMFFSLMRPSPPPVRLIIANRLASRLNLFDSRSTTTHRQHPGAGALPAGDEGGLPQLREA
jgi:hypothetical protein